LRETNILIVGGGLCGLLVADRLHRRGLNCVVLEAGPSPRRPFSAKPERFAAATKSLLSVDEHAWRYRTTGLQYEWIRVRALGGRSLLWGGWCERMDDQNFRDARALGVPWPVSLEELTPYYRLAERQLRVRKGTVSTFFQQLTHKLGLKVTAKQAAVLPARTRALCGLDLPRPAKLRTQAVAKRLILANGRIGEVEIFAGRTGKTRLMPVSAVVLCASPIETTRLLLASGIHGESGRVGTGLVDHLVATCLAVLPHPAPSLGPLGPLERCALIPRFVNVGRRCRRDYRSGFTVEVVGPIALDELGKAGVRSLGIDAKGAKQLSYCLAHAIGEAHPHNGRSVTLDPTMSDSLGRSVPVVNLAWSEEQQRMAADMEETTAAVADALAPPNSRIIQFRKALQAGGTAHEAGTARMGRNPGEAVTDAWGAVFGVRGLYIADASVMPTALDRHPTLTLVALALRTADRIAMDSRHGF
jgi:choline dehydrogenase-like flavoprotein